MSESGYSSTREAVFTETMQIGIVVRDLDATLRRYVDDFGIGPWQVQEFDPESAKDTPATLRREAGVSVGPVAVSGDAPRRPRVP